MHLLLGLVLYGALTIVVYHLCYWNFGYRVNFTGK